MIYHGEKKIFIHIPKTGGSSIESRLLEKDGHRSNGESVWSHLSKKNLIFYLGEDHNKMKYAPHAKAYELKDLYPDMYEEYESSTIVRNPYDRFCSMYFWYTRNRNNPNPMDIHKQLVDNGELMVELQYDYVFDLEDNNIIDKVFRLENIKESFCYFNIQPRHSKNMRRQKTSAFYETWPKMKNFIRDYYAKDFEAFGYDK
jgi:hypothetical protein